MRSQIVHYHGTPIWGNAGEIHKQAVSGAGAFVSFARMDQMQASFAHATSVGFDNGAFSAWKRGIKIDWQQFYKRVEKHIDDPRLEFFVIPDVVEGGEEDNDRLIHELPGHLKMKAAPVWHLHESVDRLVELCREWPRVCFGSSGEYAVIRTQQWHARMTEAFRAIYVDHQFDTRIHGLRMLDGRILGNYPLHTADSTNLACNIPKFREKYPGITHSIESADYCRGLSEADIKRLVLQGRCAILKAAIEKVTPPSIGAWVETILEKEKAQLPANHSKEPNPGRHYLRTGDIRIPGQDGDEEAPEGKKMTTYGSVCSGIEAASAAWHPLGWSAAWFSEIEKFPAAVLAHRWPDVANLGDMTKIAAQVRAGTVAAPDVLVGGTPCQAFSVAGLRQSLNDPRGQLTLSYVELANEIDDKRASEGQPPATIVWENVPGSLSTEDNAFGHFLAGLAGEDEAFEPGPRPERGKNSTYWRWNKKTGQHVSKWPKSGCVIGRQRKLAWRVLDAQHFGVAQRRRRVFVVASARNDVDPAKILFEFDGVRRNSPPSRESRQAVAALTANGVGTCGADDNQAQAGHLIAAFGGGNCSGALDVAACLTAKGQRLDYEVETFAVQSVTGLISHALTAEGFDASEDGAGRGTPVVAYGSNGYASFAEGIGPLRAKTGSDHENLAIMAVHGTQDPDTLTDLAHTLGRNHGQENAVLAFSSKDYGGDVSVDVSPTLRAGVHAGSHANSGVPPAIAYTVLDTDERDQNKHGVALSVALRGREGGATAELGDDVAGTLRASSGCGDKPHVMQEMQVRRLMPVECERLQGFPDGHTDIPWKNKESGEAPDGPRYKAIGNSMAVPVMQWIGQRIGKYHAETQISGNHAGHGKNIDVSGSGNLGAGAAHVTPDQSVRNKPFFKWVGGKFSVIEDVLRHLPAGKRLIEPFAGGGSIFLNAGFSEALVNDINPDLILTYRMLKEEGHSLITQAHRLFQDCNTPEGFAHVRSRFNNREYSDFERAAAFIYLNRHCFNGLTRYNLKGEFNVGYGKYKKPYFPLEEMEGFLSLADRLTFSCSNFADVIAKAGEGDVIFCDPPYEPMPGSDGFTSYSGGTFLFERQVELASSLKAASLRGARAVITNSSAPAIIELYRREGFDIHPLFARRSVSCAGDSRETAEDIIALVNSSKKV